VIFDVSQNLTQKIKGSFDQRLGGLSCPPTNGKRNDSQNERIPSGQKTEKKRKTHPLRPKTYCVIGKPLFHRSGEKNLPAFSIVALASFRNK
jgi:hypothetical protein